MSACCDRESVNHRLHAVLHCTLNPMTHPVVVPEGVVGVALRWRRPCYQCWDLGLLLAQIARRRAPFRLLGWADDGKSKNGSMRSLINALYKPSVRTIYVLRILLHTFKTLIDITGHFPHQPLSIV